jgi:hypothetical protein
MFEGRNVAGILLFAGAYPDGPDRGTKGCRTNSWRASNLHTPAVIALSDVSTESRTRKHRVEKVNYKASEGHQSVLTPSI